MRPSRKLLRTAALGLWVLTLGSLPAADAPKGPETYTLYALDKGTAGKYHLNPLIFHMAFIERVGYGLGLMKSVPPAALPGISHVIMAYLNRGGAVRMEVPNFRKGQPLILTFQIKVLPKKTLLFCISNYDAQEDRLLSKGDDPGKSWAIAYQVMGNKLVDIHILDGTDAKPKEYDTAIANYYLQDADPKNDALIEGMLLKDLKDPANQSLSLTYTILTQYYLMARDLPKARKALEGLKACKTPPGGITMPVLVLLTTLELQAVAKDLGK